MPICHLNYNQVNLPPVSHSPRKGTLVCLAIFTSRGLKKLFPVAFVLGHIQCDQKVGDIQALQLVMKGSLLDYYKILQCHPSTYPSNTVRIDLLDWSTPTYSFLGNTWNSHVTFGKWNKKWIQAECLSGYLMSMQITGMDTYLSWLVKAPCEWQEFGFEKSVLLYVRRYFHLLWRSM